ncbi:MAG: hypothetical protein QM704_13350 [Anaeromyxobacteraceae bacterium]
MPVAVPRPSGLSEPGAVPVLVVGCLAVGLAAGALLGVVSQWFSLLVLFPALLGFAVGVFATWRITEGRIRAPVLAGTVALCGALAAQATVHVVDYEAFRRRGAAAIRGDSPGADVDAEIDAFLAAQTGQTGLPGFIAFRAKQGVGISRGGKTTNFTGWGAYGLWMVELLVAGITAAWLAFDRARQPFCELLGDPPREVEGVDEDAAPHRAAHRGGPRAASLGPRHAREVSWSCTWALKGEADGRIRASATIYGVDAIQALELALLHAGARVAAEVPGLRWGDSSNLGLPTHDEQMLLSAFRRRRREAEGTQG